MRGSLALALALELALELALGAGCFAPEITPGSACSTACPNGLACVEGTCVAAPPDGGGGGGDDGLGGEGGGDGDPSLMAHWRFDDPISDGRASDSSGRGHDATCQSCPTPATGKIGGGYRFAAASRQVLVVPDHLDFRGSYTIAAWASASTTQEQIALLSKPYGADTANSWQLEVLKDDRVSLSSGTPHSLPSPASITAGAWHHLAGTWDGTTKRLYIDGRQVAAVDATVQYDGHAVYLGGDQNTGNEVLFWDGLLDDLRIYNRALSEAELAALAQ
jgi:hypothetical protein